MKYFLEYCNRFLALKQVQKKLIHFPVILGSHSMKEGKSPPCEGQDSIYKYTTGVNNRKRNIFKPKDSISQREKGYDWARNELSLDIRQKFLILRTGRL